LEKLLAGVRPSVVGLESIFDTMCHLSVLSEYSNKDIPDNTLSQIKRKHSRYTRSYHLNNYSPITQGNKDLSYQPPHLTHEHIANHRGIIPSQQARVLVLGRWA
jgi:hypothetical protein